MKALPPISDLLKRTKALAALDLILSPDWDGRYYSFNTAWSPSEQMASMRNGCGDEWWLVFHQSGWAALKGLDHESKAYSSQGDALSRAIQSAMPVELKDFSAEPAFRWTDTGFAYFYLPQTSGWVRANDLTPFADLDAGEDDLLRHLVGTPSDYVSFAEEYFEAPVPLNIVENIFAHIPITDAVVSILNPRIELADISEELFNQIGYIDKEVSS